MLALPNVQEGLYFSMTWNLVNAFTFLIADTHLSYVLYPGLAFVGNTADILISISYLALN